MLERAHRYVFPLVALLAILPMCFAGPSCGHDFDFHLLSWLEASTQLAHGGYPHWAFTPAWNAGEPRFLFYPPLSWLLGAVLGLLGPGLLHVLPRAVLHNPDKLWNAVPVVFTGFCLALSGFTARHFVRRYSSAGAALVASTLYLLNPYMLFTAYERTAYGELLAAAWMPLLLAAALAAPNADSCRRLLPFASGRLTSRPLQIWRAPGIPRLWRAPAMPRQILRIALPIALLWLTNAPAAVMGCYALALLTFARLLTPQPFVSDNRSPVNVQPHRASSGFSPNPRLALALTTLAGTALGLLLPAFYLLPAADERRFITSQMALVIGMRPADNTLFHHLLPVTDDARYHDLVLHTASAIAVLLLAGIALAALGACLRSARARSQTAAALATEDRSQQCSTWNLFAPLVILTAAIAFLLSPWSLGVWAHIPELSFLQFPWRLCALLTPILALFTALFLSNPLCPPGTNAVAAPARLSSLANGGGSAFRLFIFTAVVVAALLVTPAWRDFRQPCDAEDTVNARVALFHSPLGTEPTDEYTPADGDPDQLHEHNPPFWLFPHYAAGSSGSCTMPCTLQLLPEASINTPAPASAPPGQAPSHLVLFLPYPEYLVLNRRVYPSWQIRLNGQVISPAQHLTSVAPVRAGAPPSALQERNDGLIAIALPAGQSTIDLSLLRTPDQTLGLVLSLLAVLIAAMLVWTSRLRERAETTAP